MSEIETTFDSLFPINERKAFSQKLSYGTAGFRMKADSILDRVVFSVGLLACLRALERNESVGVMITASHNGAQDNGVKLVDPSGEMLEASWEEKAMRLANRIHDASELASTCRELAKELNLNGRNSSKTLCICIGKDTRESSDRLVQYLKAAISTFRNDGIVFVDYGLVITPQLHYMVMLANSHQETKNFLSQSFSSHDEKQSKIQDKLSENLNIYYQNIAQAFESLVHKTKPIDVNLDCAFGVGGKKVKELASHLKGLVNFTIVNDFEHAVPINCETFKDLASIDGDGDRLVFYYINNNGDLCLLDGDKIASLLVKFIGEMLKKTNLLDQLIVGVVQTAYANGSSTTYLKQVLGEERIFCVPTGVKYLHHKAKDLDVGVYFEANGHGTVVFSDKAKKAIDDLYNKSKHENSEISEAISNLHAFTNLINATVGDAFSDLLAVVAVLSYYSWSWSDWDLHLYTDVPSVQDKLRVKDRTIIKTSADETQVLSPPGIQDKINQCVAKVKKGRAFIRPSGTEDVVRVYAEAETQQEARDLAIDVLHIIYNDLQGTEQPPSKL
ncbi:hypothetical protein C9374_004185 [Naegleria lovaniensis]|uniref:Phosphoacetylglucosamine mutase n=1 Tax=Naegleria lovaniensis TaxID=51637 RepID=A0AA88GQV9_NAELO|nr:uncharacterized protein C9374_004185 [Naegleria lovaniensis]KAG2383514.1 hypothetical protein C9374_004185 [Naegleria lovaniensis]